MSSEEYIHCQLRRNSSKLHQSEKFYVYPSVDNLCSKWKEKIQKEINFVEIEYQKLQKSKNEKFGDMIIFIKTVKFENKNYQSFYSKFQMKSKKINNQLKQKIIEISNQLSFNGYNRKDQQVNCENKQFQERDSSHKENQKELKDQLLEDLAKIKRYQKNLNNMKDQEELLSIGSISLKEIKNTLLKESLEEYSSKLKTIKKLLE